MSNIMNTTKLADAPDIAASIEGIIVPYPRTPAHAVQVIDACSIEIALLEKAGGSELSIQAYQHTINTIKARFPGHKL